MTTVIGGLPRLTYRDAMTHSHQTLAEIVTADPRTAVVFDRLGLDYCCRGHQSLEDAAHERDVPLASVREQIEALGPRRSADAPATWLSLADLTAYIVRTHHAYVREHSPVIAGWLAKLVSRHGTRHPELADVQTTFHRMANDMIGHMLKEENILFPFIDTLAAASTAGRRLPPSPFGTILNPIRMMEADHRDAGSDLARLRALTDGYAPADACTTYRACYEALAAYEADLHRHVHLENNVLFPGAIALEGQLA